MKSLFFIKEQRERRADSAIVFMYERKHFYRKKSWRKSCRKTASF